MSKYDEIIIKNIIPEQSYYIKTFKNNKTIECNFPRIKICINNTYFYVLNYIPGITSNSIIIDNSVKFKISDIYSQHCLNLTIIKTNEKYNPKSNNNIIYENNMIFKIKDINNVVINGLVLSKTGLCYDVSEQIHPKLPGLITMKLKYENNYKKQIDNSIFSGIPVFCTSNKLIGIVDSCDIYENIITIIPIFVLKSLICVIKNKHLKNIWIDNILDPNINMKKYKIKAINNIKVDEKGYIYKYIINEHIPYQSLLWYIPDSYKNSIRISIDIDNEPDVSEQITKYKPLSIDEIGCINYYHKCDAIQINKQIYQQLSVELINFLIKNSIILNHESINIIFGIFFDQKINSVFDTSKIIFNNNDDKLIDIDILTIYDGNKIININDLKNTLNTKDT